MTDTGYQHSLGPAARTSLADGVLKTINEFKSLHDKGMLDARELNPPATATPTPTATAPAAKK